MCNKVQVFWALCMLAMGMGTWSSAHAQDSKTGQINSVLEMIDIDNQIALSNERKRLQEALSAKDGAAPLAAAHSLNTPLPVPDAQAPSVGTKPEAISDIVELSGIYGLGHNLYADVLINHKRVRFKQGSSRADRQSADFPYRLKLIAPPCASLLKEGQEVNVCLGDKD